MATNSKICLKAEKIKKTSVMVAHSRTRAYTFRIPIYIIAMSCDVEVAAYEGGILT
jgi:hypothetical protein